MNFLFKIFAFFAIIIACSVSPGSSLEYMLSLQRCPNANPGEYTIHGLWPQYNSTSWPQYCNISKHFNWPTLRNSSIMPQLRRDWMTCKSYHKPEESFLKHEWLKHGTCTPFTEIQYFSAGLASYDILNWPNLCDPDQKACMMRIIGVTDSNLLE